MLLVCFLVSSNSVVVSGILSYEFCRCSESEYSKTEDFILDLSGPDLEVIGLVPTCD